MVRSVKREDAASICTIYNYYIENTAVSFEGVLISVNEMENRIKEISASYPWLVWEDEEGYVSGYAYVNKWRERSAYRFSAEVSIYLKYGTEGQGVGSILLSRLLEEVRKTELHALVAGITLPNERSVALHEKFGFTKIAQFNEIGFKLNTWLDVGYWELILK
ncbi:MAG: GNAT family N-acetyltransferase [Treponema sp.]|jgi:phosphinothricin acetyltransferase|nr:GNAT family N-acetyltransferase [Treponema sp.]